jgi:hypothetical protein
MAKNINKFLFSCIISFIVIFTIFPVNLAYAAPDVRDMKKTTLTKAYSTSLWKWYNYDYYSQHPNNTGPVYADPTGEFGDGDWRGDTIDGNGVTWPGQTSKAAMGFAVDLKALKLLGAGLKGQLSAYDYLYYDNYKGDNDYGQPFISFYNKSGGRLATHMGNAKSVSNWVGNGMTRDIPKNAYYVIFGALGVRSGGVLNKDLDFNVNEIHGQIYDYTKPYVVRLENDQPHMVPDDEIIKQNTAANEPNIYITVSEDCTFPGLSAVLTAIDGSKHTVTLTYLEQYYFNESNGDVTYKFKINVQELYNSKTYKHFNKISVNDFKLTDTCGNAADVSAPLINKRIDTKAPLIVEDGYPNVFKVNDEFGLSEITISMNSTNINNPPVSIYSVEKNKTTVNSAIKSSDELDTVNKGKLSIQNNTNVTDVFNVIIEASDLVYNTSPLYKSKNTTILKKELFLISNQQPLRFELKNSNNSLLTISPDDVDDNTENALTNMYLKTNIDPKYLNKGAKPVIFYKWGGYDENILREDPVAKNWSKVGFKQNSNETEQISVPVTIKNEGVGSYLSPVYKDGGYLYIIPSIQDDSTNNLQIIAGAMALKYDGSESLDTDNNSGYFKLNSNPVSGEFINRGCDCTGQGEKIDDPAHYGLTGNHKKDIGFNVTKNHENLESIRYFIYQESNRSSYIAQGTIIKNSTGEYDIPISSISNKTGEYTVRLVLYSNKGDVTVQDIPVNIESPIIGVSNILYNQVTQNLDFTITYSKNSIVDGKLDDIQIEFGNDSVTEFKDKEESDMYLSIFAISEGGVIAKENWDAEIDSKQFIRTEFSKLETDSNLITADFRASLLNMEKVDNFVKTSGEKRVHIKYTTSNKVEVFNNNVTLIKKSNLPPNISKIEGTEGIYMTASQYNFEDFINVKIEESIVDLKQVYYDWVDSADASLINADKSISGALLMDDDKDNVIEFIPNDIPDVTGDELYKPYYLALYAENTAGKYIEKSFGPFYVLNENIVNERFEITVTENAMAENQILIAVDDKLHMIEELQKPGKIKVTWQQVNDNYYKYYDISFDTKDGTTNAAVVNIPYIGLSDTDGKGGAFQLKSIDLYTSDESIMFKNLTTEIIKVLPQHFVTIEGVNVKSDSNEVKYQWSEAPYDMPTSWAVTNGAIAGIDFTPREKESYVLSRMYLFLNIRNNFYRTDKIALERVANEEVTIKSVKIGEANDGYYGPENGVKKDTLIRISTKNSNDLKNIAKIKCFDQLSPTSGTAIKVNNMYKISDNEIAGIIPESIVTSGGAIECSISVNGFNFGEITSNNVGELGNFDLSYERNNRIITLKDALDEYENYSLYQNDGKEYKFDDKGKTEIYENSDYLLVYRNGVNTIAKEINVNNIEYTSYDIKTLLTPPEPTDGKVAGLVEATITMPLGSVITDKYGVINDIAVKDNHVVASAVITRSAIYSFDIKFANDHKIVRQINADYIKENYTPVLSSVTSSSAISYNPPQGPALTTDDVTANVVEGYTVLNNNRTPSYKFSKNGTYSFVLKDTEGNIQVHEAVVDWIDKDCPKPVTKKYVWYDFNDDGKVDSGEKGTEIPEGYKTKNSVVVEILFPHNSEQDRPVKLDSSDDYTDDFIIEDMSPIEGYAYKFYYAYAPDNSEGKTPVLRKMIKFTDTLGNLLYYNLVIDEIDKTDLLTQLNYSTTNYTNRDVVVSMSANRPVRRFDIVKDADGEEIEKDASPTYVFKENGTKDFNYRQIEVADYPLQGKLTANVTWIDKSVPTVNVEFNNTITNKNVVIKFTVIDGVAENAKLKYGTDSIELSDNEINRTGTFTVNKNGNYRFKVNNKYGNSGDVYVPVYNIDKEAPILNIKGRENVYLRAGDKYYDSGATAIDNMDGDITANIKTISNVNTSVSSDSPYKVTYTVKDKAGNESTAIRNVHVLNIDSAVAIIQDNVIDLKSRDVHNIKLTGSGLVYAEFIGIDGSFATKYSKGQGYDNSYFKNNGSYMSKLGTFTAQEGIYTLYVQDQERNTRIITLNFYK